MNEPNVNPNHSAVSAVADQCPRMITTTPSGLPLPLRNLVRCPHVVPLRVAVILDSIPFVYGTCPEHGRFTV